MIAENSPAVTPVIADVMLAPRDVAAFLRIGQRTLTTWRAMGRLPKPDFRCGRVIRWRKSTIEAWADAQSGGKP